MPRAWTDSVIASRKLTVRNRIGSGRWSSLFATGIREINRVMSSASLDITFEAVRGDAAANVEVAVGNGPVTYTHGNTTHAVQFNPNRMHGHTGLAHNDVSGRIEKAFIFLPETPQISARRGLRRTGIRVMTLILLHEFVHSTGLYDADHSPDDIFNGNPTADYGDRPDLDRVGVMGENGYVWFPPYFLSSTTVGKIQSIW